MGKVYPPLTEPRLPKISDEEMDEAADELGLVRMRSGQIKCLRSLGQSAKSIGPVSVARGMLMFSAGHMMELAEEAKTASVGADPELKAKLMSIRRDAAHEITVAAKIIFDSESAKPALPQLKDEDLEECGTYVRNSQGITQVAAAGDVHIH